MPDEIKCPQCGFKVLGGQKLCRNCGSRQLENSRGALETSETGKIPARVAETSKPLNQNVFKRFVAIFRDKIGFKSRMVGFLLVFLPLLALAAFVLRCPVRDRGHSSWHDCRNAPPRILGAVEMYNMDHSTMMTVLDINQLVSENYYKGPTPPCRKGGKYQSRGDLTVNGEIVCSVHGSEGDMEKKFEKIKRNLPFYIKIKIQLEIWICGYSNSAKRYFDL